MNPRVFLLVAALLLPARQSGGSTYVLPPEYEIVALDGNTGVEVWVTKPGKLGRPTIRATLSEVVVQDRQQDGANLYVLDARTGELLNGLDPPSGGTDPLPFLLQNLIAANGWAFRYHRGGTPNLTVEDGTKAGLVVQPLDAYVSDLNISGDVAIFSFSGSNVLGTAGGEVYAFDFVKHTLRWEFDAARLREGVDEAEYTKVAVDDDRVYVQSDQTLFALDKNTGAVLWTTDLPRQHVGPYDAPWTSIGRVGSDLFVTCYEMLLRIDRSSGKILWSYNCRIFGNPWPTLLNDRLYVARLAGKPERVSMTAPRLRSKPTSAVKVLRQSDGTHVLQPLSRRDIPAHEQVYWLLRQAPTDRRDVTTPSVEIEFTGSRGKSKVDVTQAVMSQGYAYVKFSMWTSKASVRVDGTETVTLEISRP